MTTLDYAQVFETQYRPGRRIRRALARGLWLVFFVLQPALALDIWRARGL